MYDTIIIGAGSAGATLASRLTEDEGRRVLLLEAGPDYRHAETLPEIHSIEPLQVVMNQELASTFTYPQLLASRSAAQEATLYVQGRGVGGSSAVNGLFAIRATVEDFDGWAAQGCTGWGYQDVLPLLNKMEGDQDFADEPYHGSDGPIPVTRPRREDFSEVELAMDEIAERLGHPRAPDHNAPHSTGLSPYAYSSFGPTRVSTNDAYLEPARARPGLVVFGNAQVDRILFSDSRAVGVSAIVDGQLTEFRASEIVVSAGALHSPAILLRSGIGPAKDLRQLGIEAVADLPVGRGLQGHPGIALTLVFDELPNFGTASRRGKLCLRFTTGVGDEVNDGMIACVGALGLGVPISGFVGWVNRVTSRGAVRLASPDPAVEPTVEFNLLSNSDDMQRLRVIVDELRAFAAQPELQKIEATIALGTAAPNTTMSEDEFAQFALANVLETAHACGSCHMGDPSDPEVVVDPKGRVLGLEGLRVADASIFPWVPRANTNLTAILVGEKIAETMRKGSTS